MTKARYKRKHKPDHPRSSTYGCVREHVLVAEELLGRSLLDGEVVHHKDGNMFNNTKENILVFKTSSDHSRYHKGGIPVQLKDGTYKCTSNKKENYCMCGTPIGSRNKKCRDCYRKESLKRLPSSNELKKLVWKKPTTSIAKDFGVSDKAVEKWCKKYNIEKPPRGYWQKKAVGKI
jgi:hypothetical protein